MAVRRRKKQNENNILRILLYILAILISVLLLIYRPLLGIVILGLVVIIIGVLNKRKTPNTKNNTMVNNIEENEDIEGHGLKDHRVAISSIDELTNPKQEEEYKKAVKESKPKTVNYDLLYANYKLPSIKLLSKPINGNIKDQEEEIKNNITIIQNTLKDFDVYAKVVEVHVGPFITQYELQLKAGTRMNKITSIHKEIAVALGAKEIRIEAPIPGKSAVGIDVPNKNNNPIALREVLKVLPKNKLAIVLGKDPIGTPIFIELDKYQSLLIAGTTGSGKSVFINTVISSILMRTKPNEVKLVLIDPKRVELGMYEGIPHLITPVIYDTIKASIALQRVVREMERRYDLFSDSKTKNIETYNNYIKEKNKTLVDEKKLPTLPYWVVIIDELYDLMLVCPKEIEDSIMRITQMARAAGICLIVSTQLPSTKVVTETIKENMPNRISFDTASVIDSKNILDMPGAEKLFGKGDMLFLPKGERFPQRIQGAYVSMEEIGKLVDFCSSQQKVVYDENFIYETNYNSTDGFISDANDVSEDDPIYNEALEFVLSTGKASASLLQRKFKLGYNRAARLIDLFEERGIIGPQQGSAPREVLYKVEDKDE